MTIPLKELALATGCTALLAFGTLAGAAEPRPLDANGDGVIDFPEMQARRSDLTPEAFNAMDKDGNGQLSRDEMRAAAKERMEARAAERFEKLDTNGDGGLSQQELNAAQQQAAGERFKKADTDGDGKLSQTEMAAARQNAARAFGERRGRRGEQRGPGVPHPEASPAPGG